MEDSRNTRRGNDSRPSHQSKGNAATASQQNRKSAKASNLTNKQTDTASNGASSPTAIVQDEHIPLNGFNATEIEALSRKGYEPKAPVYKMETKAQDGKTSSPWGTKHGAMASGKDFWLELRRQVAALQTSEGISQGG